MARGYIRRRGARSWQLVYDVPRGADGRRRQRYETVQGNKRQAEARLNEALQEAQGGRHRGVTRLTLGDFLDQWLAHVSAHVRARTLVGYRSIVDAALRPALGHVRLNDLTARHVDRFYADQLRAGRSGDTVLHHHRLLRQALGQAVKWDMLDRDVTDAVRAPSRGNVEFTDLAPPEVRRLLEAASSTDLFVPVQLAVRTGPADAARVAVPRLPAAVEGGGAAARAVPRAAAHPRDAAAEDGDADARGPVAPGPPEHHDDGGHLRPRDGGGRRRRGGDLRAGGAGLE